MGPLRVRMSGGLARISGRVESLWDRLKLAERVRERPSVERVEAEALEVVRSGRSDDEIAAEVRAILRGSTSVDAHTLALAVHDGVVTVLGSAASPEEQLRTAELVGLTPGVREVRDRTCVDVRRKARDASLARALETCIGERFGCPGVHVALVPEAAVLTGCVHRTSIKLGIQRLVSERAGRKVVNRIETTVGSPRLQPDADSSAG